MRVLIHLRRAFAPKVSIREATEIESWLTAFGNG
jgi:hypothetical protein